MYSVSKSKNPRLKERQAKNEGKAIIYGTVEKDEFAGWKKAFEGKFPFIEVDYRREYVYGTPPPMARKIMHEMKEGKETADVVIASVPPVIQMQELNLLRRYKSPEINSYPAETYDRDRYWASVISIPIVQIYNTKLVTEAELPRSALDLADSKWKDSLVMHDVTLGTLGCHWFLALKQILGTQKWRKFVVGLAKNRPKSYTLYDPVMDSVANGETKIGVTVLLHDLVKAKNAKRPVARLRLRDVPLLTSSSAIAITAATKHPNSAELLVDFLLSTEGQTKIGSTYVRIPARPGVKAPYALNRIVPKEKPILFPNKSVMSELDENLAFVTKSFATLLLKQN